MGETLPQRMDRTSIEMINTPAGGGRPTSPAAIPACDRPSSRSAMSGNMSTPVVPERHLGGQESAQSGPQLKQRLGLAGLLPDRG
jgi:hypothetical protein